jgi:RHS repeat-associated protein
VNATYTYDGNMKRVKAVSNGKTLYNVYDAAGRLVHVDEVTDNKETDYVHGMGQTLARIKNGTFTYLHPDHLGSPQAGPNEAGAVSFREHYTPFGETLTNPAANDNQSGFTGHIKDKDTGLNYMQARYYDPNIGRFLSVDPVTFTASGGNPGYFNRYSYTQNNPINATDPTGMASCFASRLSEGGSNCLGTSGGGQAGTSAEGAYNGSQTQVQAQAQPSPAPAPNSNPTTTPNPANDNTPRGANDNNKPPSLSGLLRLGSVVGALAYAEPIGNGELPEDKKNQFFFHYTDSSTAASIANSGVIMASGGKVYVTRAVLGADEVNNALFLGRRPNGGRGVVAFTAPPTFVTVPDQSIPIGEIHFGSIRHGRGGVHFNYVGKNNF